jgi:rhodanese-related sulfurtransferase
MKRNRWIIALFLVVTLLLGGCAAQNGQEPEPSASTESEVITYQNISPADAKERLDTEEGIILLDVRTLEEYTESHIPGSILIPVDVIDQEAQSTLTEKDAVIFVYCRSGRRSVIAAESLVGQGYTRRRPARRNKPIKARHNIVVSCFFASSDARGERTAFLLYPVYT